MGTDGHIVYYLQAHRVHALDDLMVIASSGVSVVTALVLVGLAYTVWFRKIRPPQDFWLPVVSLLFTGILVHLLKWLIDRPRPFATFDQIQKMALGGQSSFPSGHTSEVFTLLFALWSIERSPYLRGLLAIWALFIAYTRMALGVHYPTDILGGVAVAALSVWTGKRVLERLMKSK